MEQSQIIIEMLSRQNKNWVALARIMALALRYAMSGSNLGNSTTLNLTPEERGELLRFIESNIEHGTPVI